MKWFKVLWIFNALMSLFPVIYFFVGMADGSVTSSNMGMWMAILLLIAAILYGPVWLKNNGRLRLAKVVLIIAGAPYAMMILIYLLTIFLGPTGWQ
jgi:hypothetical protein